MPNKNWKGYEEYRRSEQFREIRRQSAERCRRRRGVSERDPALSGSQKRQIIRAAIQELKASTPCADCGGVYPPEVMQFDHRVPCSLTGAKALGQCRSLAELKRELGKGEFVCANCHRIRTHQQHLRGELLGRAALGLEFLD